MISTVENIQTRVTECENVFLPTIQHDTETTKENLKLILQHQDQFDGICTQIDSLESLILRVKCDLAELETQVDVATEELNIPDKNPSLNLFKSLNLFSSKKATKGSNLDENGKYKPVEIFKSSDYFDSES